MEYILLSATPVKVMSKLSSASVHPEESFMAMPYVTVPFDTLGLIVHVRTPSASVYPPEHVIVVPEARFISHTFDMFVSVIIVISALLFIATSVSAAEAE